MSESVAAKAARERGAYREHVLIESAGSSAVTKVCLVDRWGERHDISHLVARVEWSLDANDGGQAKVSLQFVDTAIEVGTSQVDAATARAMAGIAVNTPGAMSEQTVRGLEAISAGGGAAREASDDDG